MRRSQIWHIHEHLFSNERLCSKVGIALKKTIRSVPDRARVVAELAYHFWEERGCPEGSPEEDWYKAELIIDRGQVPGGGEKPLVAARRRTQQKAKRDSSDAHA